MANRTRKESIEARKPFEGPIDKEPDPDQVGPSVMAWYALHGALSGGPDRAAETLAWAADMIAGQLSTIDTNASDPLPHRREERAIKEAKWLLGMFSEIFEKSEPQPDDEFSFAFKAGLARGVGAPRESPVLARSLGWWSLAKEVDAHISKGLLKKQAVAIVAKRHGLEDSDVSRYHRQRNAALKKSRSLAGDSDNSAN